MLNHDTRNKIQDLISGTVINWQADYCTTTRNYLCTSFSPGTTVKKDFEGQQQIKKEQAVALETYISKKGLWLMKPPQAQHLLTIGGEAEIYIDVEQQQVIKLNDAIYYATWLDYLTSILIHNLLFPETGYELTGFSKRDHELVAVLTQPYIISDAAVNLQEVKAALEFIGFNNTRRNDYYNKELGVILEDIHDENVIVNSGFMFFIDTVFYVNLEGK